jgi:hypothetical protein
MDKERVLYIHNGVVLSYKEKAMSFEINQAQKDKYRMFSHMPVIPVMVGSLK